MSTKTNAVLMLCIGGFFIWRGAQWDSNKAALTHQRQSNQQPSGLLVSLRVPFLRNVYRGTFCRCSKQRIFLFGGVSQWDSNSTPLFSAKKACAEHLWPERLLCALHMLFIV
jgi:hypothetical protein